MTRTWDGQLKQIIVHNYGLCSFFSLSRLFFIAEVQNKIKKLNDGFSYATLSFSEHVGTNWLQQHGLLKPIIHYGWNTWDTDAEDNIQSIKLLHKLPQLHYQMMCNYFFSLGTLNHIIINICIWRHLLHNWEPVSSAGEE